MYVRTLLVYLLVGFLTIPPVTVALSMGSVAYGVSTQTAEFPLSPSLWERTGWLVHYDWGVSAYIYLQDNDFYYMITGGSEFYVIYFSLDSSSTEGYQVHGIFAQYALSSAGLGNVNGVYGEGGLFKWNSTLGKWEEVESQDDGAAFSGDQGRVALSMLGNPQRLYLVLEVDESGPIVLPHNGFVYLDVANKFAAVFMVYKEIGPTSHPGTAFPPDPVDWVINRFETANVTVIFKSYGTTPIHNIRASVNSLPEVSILTGASNWIDNIDPYQNTTHSLEISSSRFGASFLNLTFTYDNGTTGSIGPITLLQKLIRIPRVSLDISVPQEKLQWLQYYEVNVTVRNLESEPVTIDLEPSTVQQESDNVTLMLDALANVTFGLRLRASSQDVGYSVVFGGVSINSVGYSVQYPFPPNVWLNVVAIDDVQFSPIYTLKTGMMHTVQVTILNQENVSYAAVVFLKEGSYSQTIPDSYQHFEPYYQNQTVNLPANSNTTISYDVFPIETSGGSKYANLYAGIEIAGTFIRENDFEVELTAPSSPNVLLTPEIIGIYVLVFVLGILVKIIYDSTLHRNKIKQAR